MLFDCPGVLGGGGNSGFQCLNLLAQMSVAEVYCIGLDMGGGGATHWHGAGWDWSVHASISARALDRWRAHLDAAAPALAAAGVRVVNCSPVSALTAFEHLPLEAVLS